MSDERYYKCLSSEEDWRFSRSKWLVNDQGIGERNNLEECILCTVQASETEDEWITWKYSRGSFPVMGMFLLDAYREVLLSIFSMLVILPL